VDRVHAVEHHFELPVETVEEADQVRRIVEEVAGDVAADIRPEFLEQRIADIAHRADVELRHPAARRVERGRFGEESSHVAVDFAESQFTSGQRLAEDRVDVADRRAGVDRGLDAVVARAAAVLFEVLVRKLHRFEHVVESHDLHVEAGFNLFDVVAPAGREDLHRLVRAPGRADQHPADLLIDLLVVFERVDEVVGRAHHFDVERTGQQFLRTEGVGGEFCVDLVPDLLAGRFGEQFGDAEIVLEVEVNPLVDRVPGQFREDGGEREELRLRLGVSGDQLFGHAALAEHFPDVVVGGGEQLPGVLVIGVVRDLLQVRMVVGVDHRQILDRCENPHAGFIGDEIFGVHESHD